RRATGCADGTISARPGAAGARHSTAAFGGSVRSGSRQRREAWFALRAPLSPWGRGVGGEGWLWQTLPPHPRPLSPKGRGEKKTLAQHLRRMPDLGQLRHHRIDAAGPNQQHAVGEPADDVLRQLAVREQL